MDITDIDKVIKNFWLGHIWSLILIDFRTKNESYSMF